VLTTGVGQIGHRNPHPSSTGELEGKDPLDGPGASTIPTEAEPGWLSSAERANPSQGREDARTITNSTPAVSFLTVIPCSDSYAPRSG